MATGFILLLAAAYLVGSIPAAWIAARLSRGIDIRRYGSGNVGASNLWQSTSKWTAIPVIAWDFGKGWLAVWAAQQLGLGLYAQTAAGAAVVIGHNWPVFLRFNGGRGILTSLAVVVAIPAINGWFPWEGIAALGSAALALFLFHAAPIGVIVGIAAMPFIGWARGEPPEMILAFAAIFAVAVIRRLTAPRTSLTATVTTGRLLLNRLLYDRDIADRQAWLKRQPPGQDEEPPAR